MPDSSPASDYGSELDWTDAAVDAALARIEQGAASLNSADAIITSKEGAAAKPLDTEQQPIAIDIDPTADTKATRTAEDAGAAVRGPEEADQPPASLWERYRKRRGWGALSVSDLSGPSWCEVQHTYRLASKPFLPPLERPATITTSAGAVIQINATRTVKRESILDRGKEVHRRIEKQVMGDVEEVKVNVTGKEEWWALRILNTIVCLQTLLENGKVRELPVVGWLGGHLVFGVIDEVERREVKPPATADDAAVASTPSPTVNRRRRVSKATAPPQKDDQRKLDQFFTLIRSPAKPGNDLLSEVGGTEASSQSKSATASTSSDATAASISQPAQTGAPKPRSRAWGFLLSDTKTRFNRSIPPAAESRPARLQLMLYYRLLSSMLQREPPEDDSSAISTEIGNQPRNAAFSWRDLSSQLSLSPSSALSTDFLESISPIIAGSGIESALGQASTFEHFVQALQSYGDLLRGDRDTVLLDDLEIVYRMRHETARTYAKRRGQRRSQDHPAGADSSSPDSSVPQAETASANTEEIELQRAIALSLSDAVAEEGGGAEPATVQLADPERPTAQSDAAESGIESQTEDSQLPFFANPSLPIPLPSSPIRRPEEDDAAPSIPGSAYALPQNSQAASSTPDAVGEKAAVPPRYNLRRRRRTSTTDATTAEVPLREHSSPKEPIAPPKMSQESPKSRCTFSDDVDLIGVDRFQNSPHELDAWIESVLAYWTGQRPPEGVTLAQVNRCRSCEFEDGCEWREMKARRLFEETQARKRARGEPRSVEEDAGAGLES
ncbi:hypothetical protein JCM10908_002339 [Rhodotorula pacifica]|uniref:uncharacterized protein n=1 Tax=Rhodotorula pacifica TaxID=1495444 RepID=UPI00316B971A